MMLDAGYSSVSDAMDAIRLANPVIDDWHGEYTSVFYAARRNVGL